MSSLLLCFKTATTSHRAYPYFGAFRCCFEPIPKGLVLVLVFSPSNKSTGNNIVEFGRAIFNHFIEYRGPFFCVLALDLTSLGYCNYLHGRPISPCPDSQAINHSC